MNTSKLQYVPIIGKTYTLFGNSDSTHRYFQLIKDLADKALKIENDIETILFRIRKVSGRKKKLKKMLQSKNTATPIDEILKFVSPELTIYTQNVKEHLESLPTLKFWDRRLGTTTEQYHLYMLEIELTNRLNKYKFQTTDKKIALLPYCLQDFLVQCKAAPDDFDYQCKHCSLRCYQNFVSTILTKNNVEPYIWRRGKVKEIARLSYRKGESLGVFGMACIPELAWGMRKCKKNNIPVIGLPLNANRCIRWFGEFYHNSVDLDELEKLFT